MNIYKLASLETSSAKTDLATRFSRKIGLNDVAIDGIRHIASQLHDILSLFLNRLRNAQHITYLLEHSVQLVVEILMVVDYAQVRMSLPGRYNLLIQLAGYLQAFFICFFQTLRIVGCGIKLLCTIGSTHQVEHGIIAGSELGIGVTLFRDDAIPEFGREIGRNIHRAAVAYDDNRLVQRLRHAGKAVFQSYLGEESSLLSLEEKLLVLGEIVHARLGEQGRNLRNGKDLVAQTRKMFNHLD